MSNPEIALTRTERSLGIVAVAAGLGAAILDQCAGVPYAASLFVDDRGTYLQMLGSLPTWRLLLAAYGGVFLFPFLVAGFWILYRAMAPAGHLWSAVPLSLCAFCCLTINPAIHLGWGYMGLLRAEILASGPAQQIERAFLAYDYPFFALYQYGYAFIAAWLSLPILWGKTMLPRWSVLFTPLATVPIWIAVRTLAPSTPVWFYNLFLSPGVCAAALFTTALLCLGRNERSLTLSSQSRAIAAR